MIKDLLDANEKVIWEGKPDKVTYVVGHPFLYIFALFWGAFDLGFIGLFFHGFSLVSGAGTGNTSGMGLMGLFIVPFFLLHLMPVWIAIGGPIYRVINWNYINYAITEKRVYIETGIIGRDVKVIEFSDIHQPEVNVGVIEKLRGCGSVRLNPYVTSAQDGSRSTAFRAVLAHIAEPYAVFKMLKQMALDIKTDINYPNAMRPEENPGYNTSYRPR